MEMELLYSRALDMNGGVDYSDEDGENSIYKQKYERAMKELEFTKRRLQQQHEDDMEQLVGLKKQLEKKVKGISTLEFLRNYSIVIGLVFANEV
jgi:myosin-18